MLINSLGLKNFKCFEELNVKFAPITLLTGANSSGKSSLINAILAVLQTEQFPFYLSPNGKYVNMGSFEEMVRWNANNQFLEIAIDTTWGYYDDGVNFVVEEDNLTSKSKWERNLSNDLPMLKSVVLGQENSDRIDIERVGNSKYNIETILLDWRSEKVENDNLRLDSIDQIRFHYNWPEPIKELLDTERHYQRMIGPDFNYIGSYREIPVRTYYQKPKAVERISSEGGGYIDQIVEWEENDDWKFGALIRSMQDIELLHSVKTSRLKGGRFELNVKVKETANLTSLVDVGFGISQFLPIIVADLQLSDHSCLAVSQPEIHLHPKIQATFGNYLANQIKRTQKQYIIETHSEYLLNRIRLLLVTGELKPEDVRVLYFENDGVKSTVHDVEFTTKGAVKGAPDSFFDTYGIDIMDIAMNAIG